jgi:hypothetical protein
VAKGTEVQRGPDNRPADNWLALIVKLFDDIGRILAGEIRLAGAGLARVVENVVVRGLKRLILAAIGLCGLLCLIAATVLLLHKWLEWWQAFGAMGVSLLLIVVVGSLVDHQQSASE